MEWVKSDVNIMKSTNWGNYANFEKVIAKIYNPDISNKNYKYIKTAFYDTISVEASLSQTELIIPSSGKKAVIEFQIVNSCQAGSYIRVFHSGTEDIDDDNIIKSVTMGPSENFVEKADGKVYYSKILEAGKTVSIPVTVETNINTTISNLLASICFEVQALQSNNVTIDMELEEPWADFYVKNNKNEKLKRVNFLDSENLILGYYTGYDQTTLDITLKPNDIELTGTNDNWKAKNIYDLAGNVAEWTMEKTSDNYFYRGGKYFNNGDVEYAAKRNIATINPLFLFNFKNFS